MKYTLQRACKWLIIYLLLALIPLLIALAGVMPHHRGFVMELGVALGFIGLGILGLQFLFSGRIRWVAPAYGMDNILQFHREMGIIAVLFILLHPALIIIYEPDFLRYFNPAENLPRSLALIFVTIALLLLLASSLWRLQFGLNYEKWRLLHGVLSLGVIFVGVVHSIQVAHYLNALWQQVLLALLFAGFGWLVIHTRIFRPWLMYRKPWEITAITPERDDCWTLHLKPVGHPGMKYQSGQFAWITIGNTPFSMQQHPFSIASASNEIPLQMTAKASGDFTSTWKDIQPGTRAFLEGPFGSFTPVKGKNLFLVMGGIGITPAMSILRNMEKEKDNRTAVLIYANPNWEGVTFREELEILSQKVNLKLVYVLEDPPENWTGEKGIITKDLLRRHLPSNPSAFAFYICGPEPMMDATELGLRGLGIDWRWVYSERFEII
ncbi:MAG: ferric reductase-like transmembrane domain-containing protein [Bacteroidota bacterium]